MKYNERINRLFHKKGDDHTNESIVGLMKYFGWTLEEVRNLPIPSFMEIIQTVNKMEKEAEDKAKRKR